MLSAIAMVNETTPLTHVPMIMTHDAASGYLGTGLVDRWTKTQPVGLANQLECGARAFDARPLYKNGRVVWHHGSIAVNYPLEQSVDDIVAWLSHNPTELVLFTVSDCSGGEECMTGVHTAFATRNITIISDCDQLDGLTLGGAKKRGVLPGGGALLAVTGKPLSSGTACSEGNYDSSIACTGVGSETSRAAIAKQCGVSLADLSTLPLPPHVEAALLSCPIAEPNGGYGCWTSDATHDKPIGTMLSYLDGVASKALHPKAFTQSQALWQESTESVVIGTLRNSSLLTDERRSALNALLATSVRAHRWAHMGLLEVNNVCDGGPDLWAALKEVYYA